MSTTDVDGPELDQMVRRGQGGAGSLQGRVVVDPDGHRVGEVDGAVVSVEAPVALLLVVGSGGLLGLERVRRFVPVDEIVSIGDRVRVRPSHQTVHRSPHCVPGGVPPSVGQVYDHYGHPVPAHVGASELQLYPAQ